MEEYQFVQDPPKDFSCMVCANVLNEPHLTDCCGQHFCGVCLEQWFKKQAKKICPHCRSESFSYIRYLPLKRKINALQVYCPFRKLGCEEITTVDEVKTHTDGCGFAQVLCHQGCAATVLRKNLIHHCNQKCLKRKVKCQYCGMLDHFDIINGLEHPNTCEDYPLKCPRRCGQGPVKRNDLEHHAKVCPLERVPCTFREAGCDVVVLRKDLNVHVESNMQEHLMKMMSSHMELKQECTELKREYRELKVEHKELKEECSRLSSQVKTLTLAEPVKLNDHNDSFTFRPTLSIGWVSPPFYVLDGYKFCIKHKSGDKVSLLLLRGEFDDKLRWPLDLDYELTLTFEREDKATARHAANYWSAAIPPMASVPSMLHFHLSGPNANLGQVQVAGHSRNVEVAADLDVATNNHRDFVYGRELAEYDLPSIVRKEVMKYTLTVELSECLI